MISNPSQQQQKKRSRRVCSEWFPLWHSCLVICKTALAEQYEDIWAMMKRSCSNKYNADTDAFSHRDHFHLQMVIVSLRTYLIIALFLTSSQPFPHPLLWSLSLTHTYRALKLLTLKWCKIFRFNLDCDTGTVLLSRALYISRY